MFIRYALGALLWALVGMASANGPTLTISSNNTPQDRKALMLLSKEAFRRADLQVQFDSNPSSRSLDLANEGQLDGEGLRVAGLEQQYPNLVAIPERFIGISFVGFARNPAIKLEQGWASLKPLRVAFINGWKLYEANTAGVQSLTKVEQAEQLFKMLEADRIDVALYTLADGNAIIKRLGAAGIAALTPSLRDADMFLYLNKKHQAHVPRIAKALKDMKADGTYAKIMEQVTAP